MKTATRDVLLAFGELMIRLPEASKLPQMLLDLLNERDALDASHQRLKEALNAFIEYDDFTEAVDFSEADSIELERLYSLAIDAARAAIEQAKDPE